MIQKNKVTFKIVLYLVIGIVFFVFANVAIPEMDVKQKLDVLIGSLILAFFLYAVELIVTTLFGDL